VVDGGGALAMMALPHHLDGLAAAMAGGRSGDGEDAAAAVTSESKARFTCLKGESLGLVQVKRQEGSLREREGGGLTRVRVENQKQEAARSNACVGSWELAATGKAQHGRRGAPPLTFCPPHRRVPYSICHLPLLCTPCNNLPLPLPASVSSGLVVAHALRPRAAGMGRPVAD
jgi:hypothetical protein